MLTSMQGSDVFAGGTDRDVANKATFSKEAGVKNHRKLYESGNGDYGKYDCSDT